VFDGGRDAAHRFEEDSVVVVGLRVPWSEADGAAIVNGRLEVVAAPPQQHAEVVVRFRV
jgi:hypothetical protein